MNRFDCCAELCAQSPPQAELLDSLVDAAGGLALSSISIDIMYVAEAQLAFLVDSGALGTAVAKVGTGSAAALRPGGTW